MSTDGNGELRIEYMPLGKLARAPRNPKRHDLPALDASLRRFGMVAPPILDDRTGRLVAGHGRLDALLQAKAAGKAPPERVRVRGDEWLVPVVRGASFEDDDAAAAYLLTDNRLVEIGGNESDALADMLAELRERKIEVPGFTAADVDRILAEARPPAPPPKPAPPERPAKVEWSVHHGDCIEWLRAMPENSVDSAVTDPPYGLEFMGRDWDRFRTDDPGTNRWRGEHAGAHGEVGGGDDSHPARSTRAAIAIGGGKRARTWRCTGCGKRDAFKNEHACTPSARWASEVIDPYAAPPSMLAFEEWCRTWGIELLRVLKPGAHAVVFGGTRTHHRLAAGLENAGFEIRDCGAHFQSQGFPKSLRVNQDPRFCQCDAPAHSGARTGPAQARAPHSDTEAVVDGGDLLPEDARHSTGTRPNSQADCRPARGSDDAPPRQAEEIDQVRAPSRADVRGRSRSVAPVDGPVVGRGGSLSQVRDTSRRASMDSPLRAPRGACVQEGTDSNRSPENPVSSDRILSTPRESPWTDNPVGFPRCQVCGKPDASGFGTGLKPAIEPWLLVRKPLDGTIAETVQKWGTGAINIDACRYPYGDPAWPGPGARPDSTEASWAPNAVLGKLDYNDGAKWDADDAGRFPANIYACPKAGTAEREAGLQNILCQCKPGAWVSVDRARNTDLGAGRLARRVTTASGGTDDSGWRTDSSGNSTTADPSRAASASTTSTKTSSTTGSKTSRSSMRPSTSASTADARATSLETGGSHVEHAADVSPLTRSTGTSAEKDGRSMGGAGLATSARSSNRNVCAECGGLVFAERTGGVEARMNLHPT